ncbi:ABC transporter permease [Radiobacillus sp. PE A8.2]|uniref:ABC transporter permease n=1 Tax=Radiobacillus sp. PE A8.2 TaxID=3380349 RepID=UPI00388F9323
MKSELNQEVDVRIKAKKNNHIKKLWKDRYIYLLLLPGILFFLVYKYLPMGGLIIAFQDFSPFQGYFGSPWVGFEHFQRIFNTDEVLQVIWNTLVLSFLQIFVSFPVSIVLALMLNEVRNEVYKRTIQSIIYLPHFLSWVIIVGLSVIFLRGEGILNSVFTSFGFEAIPFLTSEDWFRPLITLQNIWKESGWGTIIFLAAMAGVSPHLYEAAMIDGANRWRRIWHVTLPAIRSTIIILLILKLGNVMESGFEHIFLMLNPFNRDIGNVLDTFVYFKGVQQADYSFATAVGLFKGLVGLILVVGANRLAKRFGEQGLY